MKSLPLSTPTLVHAATRLKRSLWVWAALMGAAGVITFLVTGAEHPFLALPWLATAALMATGRQPAYLALAAMVWGLSVIQFVPGVREVFGADPMAPQVGASTIETLGLMTVRVILLVTAWNQFLLYRLLYGTEAATGLDPSLPSIPEMIPNHSDLLALASRALGAVSLIASMAAGTSAGSWSSYLLGFGISLSVIGLGLGLGAAFSPTRRRAAALTGAGLSAFSFVASLAIGRWLAPIL